MSARVSSGYDVVDGTQLGVFTQTRWTDEKDPMRSGGWNYATSIGVDGLLGYAFPVGSWELTFH